MNFDIGKLTEEALGNPPPPEADDAPDMGETAKAIAGGDTPPPAGAPKKYTVRGLWEIACLHLPPLKYIWNGIALIHGAVVEFIGQPGIGKSRLVADLARHQILGRPFGDRATLKTSLKWLFVGSENGINRLNYETSKYLFRRTPAEVRDMSEAELLALAAANGYSKEDVAALDANFRTFTLEDPEDFDISMGDGRDRNETNIVKLVETLKDEKPDVLSFDPWGDVIAGKELDDGDVRQTIRILRGCLAKAGLTNTLLVVINHARMGAKEEANARGADEGNFGKNSKCLFSIARYVVNIRRASFDDNPDIELINAKNNDGRKQPPLALRLDADTMSYNLVPNFNHDKWQGTLEEAAKEGGRGNGRGAKNPDELLAGALKILEAAGDDLIGVGKFKEKMVEAKLASSVEATNLRSFLAARREEHGDEAKIVFHQELWRQGGIVTEKPRQKHGVEYISTPAHMGRYLRGWGITTDMGC